MEQYKFIVTPVGTTQSKCVTIIVESLFKAKNLIRNMYPMTKYDYEICKQ